MKLEDADQLLAPGYTDFETGHKPAGDGTYLIAGLTSMPGVKARMIRWWFADFMRTTEHYKWWHPLDHVWMDWEHKKPGKIVGAHHLVHEYIGGELQELRISFVDPTEMLSQTELESFEGELVCGRVGPIAAPFSVTRMAHVVRDTPWGCEMRSRFWLGVLEGRDGAAPPELPRQPDGSLTLAPGLPPALLKHCLEEMSYLAAFLPDLYRKNSGDPGA